ncbi:MAG: acetyl-CoA carboxylase biotin carboxyl carrier protein subunit [Acidimicrobiia bacterium]|nr:acetyl-CoA carboxylase biotin carboxyl carrier protein subunit [Acidimicrobiia bacterium]
MDVVGMAADAVLLDVAGVRTTFLVAHDGDQRFVDWPDGHAAFTVLPRHAEPERAGLAGSLAAPMPGTVRRVLVEAGASVVAGQVLVVVEAMKMEHQVVAPAAGGVESVLVTDGEQVETGQALLVLTDEPS